MTMKPLMTICAGYNKVANRGLLCLFLIMGFCVACIAETKSHLKDVPVQILDPETQDVSIERLISSAQSETEKVLSGAYLTFFSFVGDCDDLPGLEGQVELSFIQESSTLFGARVLMARVSVDTVQQTLSLEATDETSHYPSTERLELDGKSVREIATILYDYLVSADRCGGMVALARGETNGLWGVRCGPPDKVFLECLEIDPATGEIVELKR